MRKQQYKRMGVAALLCAAVSTLAAPNASANAGVGCETIRWGFLGTQLRTICDGPRQADGTWMRERRVWHPAGYMPARSYCGSYSCSYSEGYYYPETTSAYEMYPVTDSNVLGDEPGWLPAGTMVLR